ncbi:MAG: type VII toxin-antitoxin system HepT family RNase toxin [Vicinamibacterales bacterium]
MSPVDAAIIRRKLGHIAETLHALRPLAQLTLDDYRARLYERKAAERLLQEAIEAALDINAHLIAEQGGAVPEDYYLGFIALGALQIIPDALAHQLAPSAGLRNRLVHEYDAIDDGKVLTAIGTLLTLYPRFVEAIETFLSKADRQE